jgi:hypothetical protein
MLHETVGMAAGQTEFTCKSGLALSCSLEVEKTLAVAACRDTTKNSQGISNRLPLTLHQFLWDGKSLFLVAFEPRAASSDWGKEC